MNHDEEIRNEGYREGIRAALKVVEQVAETEAEKIGAKPRSPEEMRVYRAADKMLLTISGLLEKL